VVQEARYSHCHLFSGLGKHTGRAPRNLEGYRAGLWSRVADALRVVWDVVCSLPWVERILPLAGHSFPRLGQPLPSAEGGSRRDLHNRSRHSRGAGKEGIHRRGDHEHSSFLEVPLPRILELLLEPRL
jgi:hypothetical protein